MPAELDVVGAEPFERADAARNRRRILAAADRLVTEHGVNCVTMEAIADAAVVGKGTLFRRFGDRATLLRALLDEGERAFQEGFIRGPAPLGPGAPACQRLIAFGHALIDRIETNGELIMQSEAGAGLRLRANVYGAYRAHVTALLRDGVPGLDADYAADALLGPLAAEVVLHQRRARGMSLERIKDGWQQLVGVVLRDTG
jgi:AcrR family transcriptional regulator